jgi:quercetin dioxygenase-like cupin family protein
MQVSAGEPIRSVVVESEHAVVVAWHVEPGQAIAPHTHPHGQDTWTILAGSGQYQVNHQGHTVAIGPGDIVVAAQGQVHGVCCTSPEPLRLISVVAPLTAGYVPLAKVE